MSGDRVFERLQQSCVLLDELPSCAPGRLCRKCFAPVDAERVGKFASAKEKQRGAIDFSMVCLPPPPSIHKLRLISPPW